MTPDTAPATRASFCWAGPRTARRSSTARAAITRRLIERHGFTIVAVEADWPDAAQVDAFIRGGRRPSRADPEAAKETRQRHACMEPWQRSLEVYGHLTDAKRLGACEGAKAAVLRDLLERRLAARQADGTEYFDAAQNARVVASAERYYRSMFRVEDDSWNLRDTRMADTLDALLDWHRGRAVARR